MNLTVRQVRCALKNDHDFWRETDLFQMKRAIANYRVICIDCGAYYIVHFGHGTTTPFKVSTVHTGPEGRMPKYWKDTGQMV